MIRKATVVSKLDEDILDNIEDEEGIAEERETTEAFQNFLCKKVIIIKQFFTWLREKGKNSKFPEN